MSRVFFHVQHLLGIGHIRRAAVLARTLAASGFDVLLVSGGAPLKLDLGGARFHQLPPVRARDEGLAKVIECRRLGNVLEATTPAAHSFIGRGSLGQRLT